MHTGVGHDDNPPGRGSGRWAWGSGANPNQHNTSIVARYERLKAKGLTKEQIIDGLGIEKTEIRDLEKLSSVRKKCLDHEKVLYLSTQKGMGPATIHKETGIAESTINGWLKNWENTKMAEFEKLATVIKDEVLKRKYVDIGEGTEIRLKTSKETIRAIRTLLVRDHGFESYHLEAKMPGNNRSVTMDVLCAPGVTKQELKENRTKVDIVGGYVVDETNTVMGIKPPVSIDSKRIQVAYDSPKDGVVEIRRGVPDLQLGDASYAQVRIAVDGSHYIKGMAMYMDDATAKKLPPGVDLLVNSNKKEGVPLKSDDPNAKQVLKPFEEDKVESLVQGKKVINEANPFGSAIKTTEQLTMAQAYYNDPKTGERKQSAINIVNEQGDWDEWSREVSSQMLSKQSSALAKKQLNITYNEQKLEFENLKNLNNPIVRQNFLNKFADECDSKAVYLKAAGFPRQSSKVLLPFNEIKPHECVCPTLENGTQVVLVRYPHEGKYQIPELVVNNNHPKARKAIGTGSDAIGISPKTAPILSGADFDGDTVLVIPVGKHLKIQGYNDYKGVSAELKSLQEFDTKIYKVEGRTGDDLKDKELGLPVRPTKSERSRNMGVATNLITDMQITGGANVPFSELARATKYAMVVIDSYKHDLDWRQARKDFGIGELHAKYQGKASGGARTIISRAKREKHIPERDEALAYQMTPEEKARWAEGEKIYKDTGKTRYDSKTGKYVPRMQTVKELAWETDPYKLTSGRSKENPGTQIEAVYAEHSARMKALANAARKEARAIEVPHISRSAAKVYAEEVASLNDKLNKVYQNRPLERIARLVATETANAQIKSAGKDNLDRDDVKKIRDRATKAARNRISGKRYVPDITDREWEAIQANAYSVDNTKKILAAADNDRVRQLAMPKKSSGLSQQQMRTILAYKHLVVNDKNKAMTIADIAKVVGCSASTVSKVLSGKYNN